MELNIDPLTKAYKKNNVEYYLRVVSGKDTIYTIDSVCVNRNGLVTLKEIKKGYADKTSYEYDLLNRIIQTEHDSDIHSKFKTYYKQEKESNTLIGFNTNSLDKKPSSLEYFIFENNKLKEQIVIDIKSNDTIMKTQYKYNSKKNISEISKNNLIDNYEVKTEYGYRKNNTLSEIIGHGEVKYISEKTGLIDSVKQKYPHIRTTYKYHFKTEK